MISLMTLIYNTRSLFLDNHSLYITGHINFNSSLIMGATCCNNTTEEGILKSSSLTPEEEIQYFLNQFPFIHEPVNKQVESFGTPLQNLNVLNQHNQTYIGPLDKLYKQRHKCIILYREGFFYSGEIDNGMRHGQGKLIYSNGDVYDGEWIRNQATGRGVYTSKEQSIKYRGAWFEGKQHGKGIEQYEDGSYFEGEFFENQKHGHGKLVQSDGKTYQGNFCHNKMEEEPEDHIQYTHPIASKIVDDSYNYGTAKSNLIQTTPIKMLHSEQAIKKQQIRIETVEKMTFEQLPINSSKPEITSEVKDSNFNRKKPSKICCC